MSKRDTKIDELRGLLMIMVVMGHVVQYVACPDNFDSNIVFRLIYSFHMPLFMFLSGYVAQMVHPHMNQKQLIKRICSLLVPFFVWGAITAIRSEIPYYEIILHPDRGLWFLWTLAIINVLVYVAS